MTTKDKNEDMIDFKNIIKRLFNDTKTILLQNITWKMFEEENFQTYKDLKIGFYHLIYSFTSMNPKLTAK